MTKRFYAKLPNRISILLEKSGGTRVERVFVVGNGLGDNGFKSSTRQILFQFVQIHSVKGVNLTVLLPIQWQTEGQTGSLTLVWQPAKEKENS